MSEVRVQLPTHLRDLAGVRGEVRLDVAEPVCVAHVLDAVEAAFPVLRGAIRAHGGGARRPFVRFFACEQDWSHERVDTPLPDAVARGEQPLLVVGAMAGG